MADGEGAERMKIPEMTCGKYNCYPGETACSPTIGGGCCPIDYPVCCAIGANGTTFTCGVKFCF